MRRWWIGAVAAFLMLMVSVGALADSEGAIVQSSCSVVPSGDYYLVHCYAQIHNNSDQVICLENGAFELHSGEQLLASQNVDRIWPSMINPGEDGYMFGVVAFEPDENGQPVIPQISGLEYTMTYMTVEQEFASIDLGTVAAIERDERGGMTVECEVTNGTDATAYSPAITFGLYTDGGAMVYADGIVLSGVGIPAGGSLLMRFEVDDAIVEQWDTYGANVTSAHAVASFRDGTD